jgi:hypothetical protein
MTVSDYALYVFISAVLYGLIYFVSMRFDEWVTLLKKNKKVKKTSK